jgi:TPR repeat protein
MLRHLAPSVLTSAALLVLSACAEIEYDRNVKLFQLTRAKAERGDTVAAMHLGGLYRQGIGTAREPEQALHWYEIGGRHGGWAMIGRMYDSGEGVAPDPDTAARYYRRAAETGEPMSMYRLGCLHAARRLATSDAVEGYTWLVLSLKIGDASAHCHWHDECDRWPIKDEPGCRKTLEATLTPEQRGEAERRAADWLAARSNSKN